MKFLSKIPVSTGISPKLSSLSWHQGTALRPSKSVFIPHSTLHIWNLVTFWTLARSCFHHYFYTFCISNSSGIQTSFSKIRTPNSP